MTAECLTAAILTPRHGFFTRNGGVSDGPFASLNVSLSSPDDRAKVMANRALIARAIGAEPDLLLGVTQVHGIDVITATQAWRPGDGGRADAMVTAVPGLALGVITADCAPVLFADAERGVIGAAHAGWRGAAAGVLEATMAAMQAIGAMRIVAVVGPCIAQESYEVGTDMRDAVLAHDAAASAFFVDGVRDGRFQFDLAGYCAERLHRAGAAVVQVLGRDTCAETEYFFSHRRRTLAGGGPIGHQMSAITL
jgi:YfiH family protein